MLSVKTTAEAGSESMASRNQSSSSGGAELNDALPPKYTPAPALCHNKGEEQEGTHQDLRVRTQVMRLG
jgi:hypothetical protein